MITNLPTPEDFYRSGNELLNFAWGATSDLLTEFDQADYYGVEKSEISEKYWAAARRTLSTSLTVVQQGVELILKGKIAEFSPYLLISDPPSRWPSPYQGSAVDFSEFRTVDAQDLIRIYDTFAANPFTSEFTAKFHALRKKRNAIMHSVSSGLSVEVLELVDSILYMHKSLFPAENWATLRRTFLENAPESELGSGEFATNRTCWEFSIVRDMLKPAQVLAYLGIDKKQRLYICPKCLDAANTDMGFEFQLASLVPQEPAATHLYCPVCNDRHEITRGACTHSDCHGNVLSKDEGRCLTCGHY